MKNFALLVLLAVSSSALCAMRESKMQVATGDVKALQAPRVSIDAAFKVLFAHDVLKAEVRKGCGDVAMLFKLPAGGSYLKLAFGGKERNAATFATDHDIAFAFSNDGKFFMAYDEHQKVAHVWQGDTYDKIPVSGKFVCWGQHGIVTDSGYVDFVTGGLHCCLEKGFTCRAVSHDGTFTVWVNGNDIIVDNHVQEKLIYYTVGEDVVYGSNASMLACLFQRPTAEDFVLLSALSPRKVLKMQKVVLPNGDVSSR